MTLDSKSYSADQNATCLARKASLTRFEETAVWSHQDNPLTAIASHRADGLEAVKDCQFAIDPFRSRVDSILSSSTPET